MNEKTALKQLKILEKKSSDMRLAAESWGSDFEILISTIMSARTRDEVTIPTAEKLFKKFSTPKKLGNAKHLEIEKIIKPVNFYKNKTKNIIACAKELDKIYKGKIPLEINKLIKLPGVGRKTANVFLSEIGENAIGVDTHVSYISQKLGWTKNKKPEKIEEDLKKLFSKKHWGKVNSKLGRFGKTYTSRKEKDRLLEEIIKLK
jgi:endonuclease-3